MAEIIPDPATDTTAPDGTRAACLTIAQLAADGAWRLRLLHQMPQPVLLWTTRGQGLITIEGVRRGVGVHNAIYLPAGVPFSYDLGAQGFGQVLILPDSFTAQLPADPRHLRIRDNHAPERTDQPDRGVHPRAIRQPPVFR